MNSSKKYPWNAVSSQNFWDAGSDDSGGGVFTQRISLKDRLANPSGMRFDQLLRDCSMGVAMVMQEIEAGNGLTEETGGFRLLMEIVQLARAEKPYHAELARLKSAAETDPALQTLVNQLIKNLEEK